MSIIINFKICFLKCNVFYYLFLSYTYILNILIILAIEQKWLKSTNKYL